MTWGRTYTRFDVFRAVTVVFWDAISTWNNTWCYDNEDHNLNMNDVFGSDFGLPYGIIVLEIFIEWKKVNYKRKTF
jgi:hypothetical protein